MKNSTTNNIIENSVHFIMQGKGGVGKTTVAMLLLQVLQQFCSTKVYGIDTDPVNQTLASFKSLAVQPVFIMGEDNEVDPLRFDKLIDSILIADKNNFVIDTGATSYLPTINYLKNTELIDLFYENKKETFIHVPISGGQATADTIAELKELSDTFPKAKLVIWENQYFGEITAEFRNSDEFKKSIKNAIATVILKKLDPKTDGFLFSKMTSELKSFADIINDKEVSFMTRRRLQKIFNDIAIQITNIFQINSDKQTEGLEKTETKTKNK